MKEMYVIAIAFLAFSAVNAASFDQDKLNNEQGIILPIPTACPYPAEKFPNVTTNIAHEYNCSRFYKCHVGNAISQDCPLMNKNDPLTRLHFNRLEQVCDWPWRAGCDSCPQRYENGTYPPPSKISHESGNCQYYYECINSVKYLRYCTIGTCFSRTCQTCVTNGNGGKCDLYPRPPTGYPNTPIPSTGLSPTPSIPTIQPACRNGDTIQHPCDCAKYYSCYNNDLYLTQCTGGLHYSPLIKQCLPPNEAGCYTPRK